jgi:hypothetical protein
MIITNIINTIERIAVSTIFICSILIIYFYNPETKKIF